MALRDGTANGHNVTYSFLLCRSFIVKHLFIKDDPAKEIIYLEIVDFTRSSACSPFLSVNNQRSKNSLNDSV